MLLSFQNQKRNKTDNIVSSPVFWSKSTLTFAVVELFLCWVVTKGETRAPTWLLQGNRREIKPVCRKTFIQEKEGVALN